MVSSEILAVFWHPDVLSHDTGRGFFEAPASPLTRVAEPHPEGADRMRNMVSVLERGPISPHLEWHRGRAARREELTLFHDPAYLDRLEAWERDGGGRLSPTTVLGRGSFHAACLAAGTTVAAMEHVLAGAGPLAYALVRPPGHHAAPAQADGYCFLNNLAVAVAVALGRGVTRIAVIDWDVHHGNGTQEGFYERSDVFTVSLHMDHGAWGPSHPQEGSAREVGRGRGRGYNLNVPLPMGTTDSGYLKAFEALVAPALESYAPELIVVAAGQDASQFDPNGRQLVTMSGFHRLGGAARALADRLSDGRLLLVQEGGYAVSYAAYCLHATLEGVLGRAMALEDPLAYLPDHESFGDGAVEAIRREREAALGANV